MPRETNIQIRRGSASDWASVNPTLASGEMAIENDIGDSSGYKIGVMSSFISGVGYQQNWVIGFDNGTGTPVSQVFYAIPRNGTSSPPSTGWYVVNGTAPAPTLS
jgi:hypothetical protein